MVKEPMGVHELAPEPAFRLADAQLVVLVENRESDGAFLFRVIAELDPALRSWCNAVERPLRLESLGGKGQMKLEVEKLEGKVPRPRYVVVVDSDRRGPSEQPSGDARRLKSACDKIGVPCWVLAKREAENYLPRELLEQKQDGGMQNSLRVSAWLELSEDQKDFFDMKAGLPSAPTPVEDELFANLSASTRSTLRPGFGNGVGTCWSNYKGQCKSALRARGRGDLELGLAMIRKEV